MARDYWAADTPKGDLENATGTPRFRKSPKSRPRYVELENRPVADFPPLLGGRYIDKGNSDSAATDAFPATLVRGYPKPCLREIELAKRLVSNWSPLLVRRYVGWGNLGDAAADSFPPPRFRGSRNRVRDRSIEQQGRRPMARAY